MRILVASMPRCGSTMLIRAISGSPPGGNFPHGEEFATVRNFDKLPDVPFLKTHRTAPDSLPPDIKAIFLYGDPITAVVSTREKRFNARHFKNCGYFDSEPPRIYERDDLGFKKIFDSWTKIHDYPVLAVRYRSLWDAEETIGDFIGRKILLPPRKARSTSVAPALKKKLTDVYGDLKCKIDEYPDVSLLTQPDTHRTNAETTGRNKRGWTQDLTLLRSVTIRTEELAAMLGTRTAYYWLLINAHEIYRTLKTVFRKLPGRRKKHR